MEKFIPAKQYYEKTSTLKMDAFVKEFNKHLKTGKTTMNTGLDHCSTLNDDEFELVVKQAKENGYVMTRFDDNYQTTTYKLIPL